MTAAGKIPPAKVLVVGAGVAGLAAIQVKYWLHQISRTRKIEFTMNGSLRSTTLRSSRDLVILKLNMF
jgi:NAD/NADP transhydrogenase alpha subunit